MFRRSEESEWSRLSKALTGREKESEDRGAPQEPLSEPAAFDAHALDPQVPAPSPSPAARPPIGDTNLTISRSGTNAGPHPTFSADDVESTIGEHSLVDGTFRSENSIRIRGTAQGEVESAKAIFIEENAKVAAKVTAISITVAGEVNGELNCTGRVEIRPSGRVTGTINAASLIMQEGAFFDGNLHMPQPAPEASPATKAAMR